MFETTETIGQTLAKSLTKLLDKYGLRKKIIVYVKNEGTNLNVVTIALKAIVNYKSFGLEKSFHGTLLWACFFKSMSIWHCRGKGV